MRLTRPGADQTPEGSQPNASEKDRATVISGDTGVSGEVGNSAHLTEPGSHGLGGDVVDPGAHTRLGAGEVLQPPRRPQNRHDLQVQTGDLTPASNRRLMPAGDIRHGDRRTIRRLVV